MDEQDRSNPVRGRLRTRRIAIPFVLAAVTVVTGSLGTYRYLSTAPTYAALPGGEVLVESLFASFGFLILNSGPYPVSTGTAPLLVYVGRFTGLLFFSYAAILGFGALFADQLKPLRIRWWHLRDRLLADDGGHVVVCGVGHKGYQLASSLLAEGRDVVAVEHDPESTRARELGDEGAVVLREDATRERTLGRRAAVHRADEVFVNCGDDYTNTRVVRALANALDGRHGTAEEHERERERERERDAVRCHAHVASREQRHFVHDQLGDRATLHLQTYDTAGTTARELLQRRPPGRVDENPDAERVHVVLFGWNGLSKATVFELCQRMHYLDGHDRAITVVCSAPEDAREELHREYPALSPDHWADDSVRAFVDDLFPDVSFVQLPTNEDVMLTDRFGLYDRLRPDDVLTVIVADEDGFRSGLSVSTLLPRLESIEQDWGLDTTVHYFADAAEDDADGDDFRVRVDSDAVEVRSFGEFVEACTPGTVRGERRDRLAGEMALFFHLRYDYHPTAADASAVDRRLAELVPFDPPSGRGYGYGRLSTLWSRLSVDQRRTLAAVVWRDLSGTMRDANRHAADHVPVKHRLASLLDVDPATAARRLSATEHRRWCAEKFLDGWEPLPLDEARRWRESDAAQRRFRAQKYHLDLRPNDELKRLTDGEAEKDVSLVRFVLEAMTVEEFV